MESIKIFFKILSGDVFDLNISYDITKEQFYNIVWKKIPMQIPLQSLDIFRKDLEDPIPENDMPLFSL